MPRTVSPELIAGALAALVACGTARVVQKDPYGGVIELQGDHNKAMEQANEEMAAHCGLGNVILLSEGYVTIDSDTAAGATQATQSAAAGTTQAEQSAATAWRIRYQCGDGAPLGAAGPPPPRPPGS